MVFATSRYSRRIGAVSLLIFIAWLAIRIVLSYSKERLRLSAEIADIRSDYQGLLDRRVDIPMLERQLSLLNASEAIRQSTIEAANDRAALVKLQQIARTAVEAARGKLLSSIESTAGQAPNTVGLLIRARVAQEGVSQLLSNMENGSPRIGVEEASLTSRPGKAGEVEDIELTLTLRGRWLAAGQATMR